MKHLKKLLLLAFIPLFAFGAHKFYVSVTNVQHSDKDQALQITTRIFIDDFEDVIEERYDFITNLSTPEESELANMYIEKYLKAKFVIKINGEIKGYTFLGKRYDNDVVICYLEVPEVDLAQLKSIEIQNEVLMDLFEEQQNILHYKIKGKKRSFVLIKENNKGMLNL